jgi:hypothetical protein
MDEWENKMITNTLKRIKNTTDEARRYLQSTKYGETRFGLLVFYGCTGRISAKLTH